MPVEILALIDKPHWFLAVLLVGALIGMGAERAVIEMQRRSWRNGKHSWQWGDKRNSVVPMQSPWALPVKDAADQLRIVMDAEFAVQPLLNKSEARVFRELDRMVLDANPNWQVMAQVSLGEVLRCKNSAAFRCINSKRVDLLLMDEDCRPRHAIEYQGAGHHQGTAAIRDAVKKEALRRAGIGYHEVVAGHTTRGDLKRLVDKIVNRSPDLQSGTQPPVEMALTSGEGESR